MKTDTRIKIGMVGVGRIFPKHLSALQKNDRFKLVAICDLDATKCQDISQTLNVPGFTSVSEMLEVCTLDVVAICTDSGSHHSVFNQVVGKVKTIIIEKPICLSLELARDIIEKSDRSNTNVFVVKQNRYNEPVKRARSALMNGDLGRILVGAVRVRWCRDQSYYSQASWRGTWAGDGGVITNQAIHHIDLLQWFMGMPSQVFAYARTNMAKIEAEDTLVASLSWENGSMATIEATTCARPNNIEGSVSFLGDRGAVEVGGFAVNKMNYLYTENTNFQSEGEVCDDRRDVYGSGHEVFYSELVKAVSGQQYELADAVDAIRSLEIIHAIYESVDSGTPVALGKRKYTNRLGEK